MRFPLILLRPPIGLPAIKFGDAQDHANHIIGAGAGGGPLGIAAAVSPGILHSPWLLALLAMIGSILALAGAWHYRADTIRIERWSQGLVSGHQRALFAGRGGARAMRRGRLLKWSLPGLLLVGMSAGGGVGGAVARLFIHAG